MKKEKKDEVETKEQRSTSSHKVRNTILIVSMFIISSLCLIYLYAHYVGVRGIAIREYNVKNESIPASFDGFSIVQFSDLELGSTFDIEDVDKLVKEINALSADIVVFTGDIVAPHHALSVESKDKLIEYLSKIDAQIGKYSVRGDDDQKTDVYNQVMSGAGFKDISNSYELIYYKGLTPIVLYGLDSLVAGAIDYDKAFSYPSEDEDTEYMATYRILLAHEPDVLDKVRDYNVLLMLSGHSHNSEINIPYLRDLYHIEGASKYYSEHYRQDGTELYISSGLGTSKYEVRLFSRPSISIYRLYTSN